MGNEEKIPKKSKTGLFFSLQNFFERDPNEKGGNLIFFFWLTNNRESPFRRGGGIDGFLC